MFALSDYEEIRDRLISNNRPAEALEEFDAALKEDPENAYALHGKAHALRELGKLEDAILFYDLAIEADPEFHYSWEGKGNALSLLKRYEEAIQAYGKAIQIDQKSPVPWHGKGNVLDSLKRYEEAIQAYEMAIQINQKFPLPWNGKGSVLYSLERYEEAIQAYDKAIEIHPKFADPWNGKGNALHSLKRYEDALQAYEIAIEIDPNYKAPKNGKGNSLNSLKRHKEAIQAFEKIIEIDSTNALPWIGKGFALNFLKRHEEAFQAFEKAIKIDPINTDQWNGKGNALHSLNSYEEAIEAYEISIEIDPKNVGIWLNLSLIEAYGFSNRQRSFRKVISIAEDETMQWVILNANHLIQQFGAVRLSERLIQSFHLNETISYMGFCHEIQQKCKLTDPIIQATPDANPFNLKDLTYLKGIIYYLEGDPEVASEYFDTVLDQDEERLDAWFYLIQSRYGYHAEFIPDLNDAVKLAKDYEEYRLEDNYGYNLYYAGHLFLVNEEPAKAMAFFERALAVLKCDELAYLPALYMQLICAHQISLEALENNSQQSVTESKLPETPSWTPAMEAIASEITEVEREQLLMGEGYLHGVSAVEFTLDQPQFKRNLFRYVHFNEILLGVQLMWEYLNEQEDGLVTSHPYPELYSPDKVWHLPAETLDHLEKQQSDQGQLLADNLRTKLGRDFIAAFDTHPRDQLEIQVVQQIKSAPRNLNSNLDLIAYCYWQHSLAKRDMVLLSFYALLNHKAQGQNWEAVESEFQKFVRANLVSQGSSVGIALGLGVGTVAGPVGSIVGGVLGSVLGKWIWDEIKPIPEVPDYLVFKEDFAQHVIALQMDERYAGWIDGLFE